jgi:hypothetical protein
VKFSTREGRIELPPGPPRGAGLHVSHVIRDIALTAGFLDEKYRDEDLDEFTPEGRRRQLRFLLGFAIEEYVARQPDARDAIYMPGELQHDGIWMTADFLHPERPAILDAKATFQSTRRSVDSMWMRLTQLKAYCYGYGLTYFGAPITEADLLVYYVRGDYRDDWPQYLVHAIEFTEREVGECWLMLTNHARTMEDKHAER